MTSWDTVGEQLTQGSEAHLQSSRTSYCSHVQIYRGQTLKRQNCPHERQEPQYNNASTTGQPTCSYETYRKNDLALQLFCFVFFSSRQLLRFDFNAFCVVLYFHAKILMYLNVFILLNVLGFILFLLVIPQNCCNYTHVAVSNFFL